MLKALNDYRQTYNKNFIIEDKQQNEWCNDHCWAMIREGKIYHTESWYLNEWKEIIVECWQYTEWDVVVRNLLFQIDSNRDDREILLNSTKIGYAVIAWKGKVYLTIRGKK